MTQNSLKLTKKGVFMLMKERRSGNLFYFRIIKNEFLR